MQRTERSRRSAWGWRAISCTAAVLLIAACSDHAPTGPTPPTSPPPPTAAPLTVTGKVISSRTGQPVVGAMVSIGTVTDTTGLDGGFQLTDLTAGAATLRCPAEGFQNIETSIVVADTLTAQQILRLTPVVRSMSIVPRALTIAKGSTNILWLSDQDGVGLLTPNVVTLESDHENVASVESRYNEEWGFYAIIVGTALGEATITAESGGITATANIRVVEPAPSTNQLAFVRGGAIYVSDFAGAEPVLLVRIADLGEGAHDFALSRDGSMIAFVSAAGREICIARSNGSDRRCTGSEVFDSYVSLSSLAWSPDGHELVFSGQPSYRQGGESGSDYEPRMSLLSLAVDDMTTRTIMLAPVNDYAVGASWTPDGSRIAFAMDGAIWTMNRGGSDVHVLARVSDPVVRVEWSRNGQLGLGLYGGVCDWYCDSAIAIANADGTGFRVLATARQADYVFLASGFAGPLWSLDATLIAYDYLDCSEDGYTCPSDVIVARTDNGEEVMLFKDAQLINWRP